MSGLTPQRLAALKEEYAATGKVAHGGAVDLFAEIARLRVRVEELVRQREDLLVEDALAERARDGDVPVPLVVSRFDVVMEPALEEEPLLRIGCVAEDGHPVVLELDPEARDRLAGWLGDQAGDDRRRAVHHRVVAARLRRQPGVWGVVGTYVHHLSAHAMARNIRRGSGAQAAYGPAGSFQTRTVAVLGGQCLLEARFVGPAPAGGGR